MEKLRIRAEQILIEIEKADSKLNFGKKKGEIAELETEAARPEIWNNPQNAQQKMRELADLKKKLSIHGKLCIFRHKIFLN